MAHTKSGMGGDVDPVRFVFAVLTLMLALKSYQHHSAWLLVGSIISGMAFAWWMTRCWYKDEIDRIRKSAHQT